MTTTDICLLEDRMLSRLGILLLACGLIAVGCSAPSAAKSNPETDRAAINAVRDQFIAAYKAADADRVAALYTDNAVAMPKDQPTLTGRSEILKHERDQFSQISVGDVQIKPDETQLMGDWAVDRGTFSVTVTPKSGGGPMTDTGRYLVILQRQSDGSWKVTHDIDNGTSAAMPPPPPPVPPAPPRPPMPKK